MPKQTPAEQQPEDSVDREVFVHGAPSVDVPED